MKSVLNTVLKLFGFFLIIMGMALSSYAEIGEDIPPAMRTQILAKLSSCQYSGSWKFATEGTVLPSTQQPVTLHKFSVPNCNNNPAQTVCMNNINCNFEVEPAAGETPAKLVAVTFAGAVCLSKPDGTCKSAKECLVDFQFNRRSEEVGDGNAPGYFENRGDKVPKSEITE